MNDLETLNAGLALSEPELFEYLNDCLHKHEIRGSEEIVIKSWLGKALVTESLLNLLYDKHVEINGIKEVDGELEPTFVINKNSPFYKGEDQ